MIEEGEFEDQNNDCRERESEDEDELEILEYQERCVERVPKSSHKFGRAFEVV